MRRLFKGVGCAWCASLLCLLSTQASCGYQWGPPRAGGGLRASYRELLTGEGRFELSHDGGLRAGRSELLNELLWAYQQRGGAPEALKALRLELTIHRRPLTPTHASFDGALSVWSGGSEGQRTTLKATIIRPSVVTSGAISAPEGEVSVTLCQALGAQLATWIRAGDI